MDWEGVGEKPSTTPTVCLCLLGRMQDVREALPQKAFIHQAENSVRRAVRIARLGLVRAPPLVDTPLRLSDPPFLFLLSNLHPELLKLKCFGKTVKCQSPIGMEGLLVY